MPNISQVHINAAMTELSAKYGQGGFISDQLFPVVPVKKQSDYYYIFDSAREALRQTDDNRAPGAEARDVDYAITNASYYCGDHALKDIIPDEVIANADAAINPEMDTTEFLVEKINLNKEITCQTALSAALVSASKYCTLNNTAGTTSNPLYHWSDYTNGDPFNNITYGIEQVRAGIQKTPNVIVIPFEVFQVLKNHPDITDRIKYGGNPLAPGAITAPRAIAQLFGVDEIIVPDGFKNTAIKGQTANVSAIWSDDVYVAYVEKRPGLKKISLGYTFVWTGSGNQGMLVRQWRDEVKRGTVIEASRYYDQKIVASAAGWKITNCIQ